MILNHLQEADLQMNIQKCEFNVKEIVFLEVIISELLWVCIEWIIWVYFN